MSPNLDPPGWVTQVSLVVVVVRGGSWWWWGWGSGWAWSFEGVGGLWWTPTPEVARPQAGEPLVTKCTKFPTQPQNFPKYVDRTIQ